MTISSMILLLEQHQFLYVCELPTLQAIEIHTTGQFSTIEGCCIAARSHMTIYQASHFTTSQIVQDQSRIGCLNQIEGDRG